MHIYKNISKPFLDFFISGILLICLSPIIIGLIIVFSVINKGDIFFLQTRPGLNAKPFKIIKFKTMKDVYDIHGNLLSDDVRLTRFGKFVRSTSLDEILQLINVLKGEMSLIGPRPLMMSYLPRYSTEQFRRHQVKPGITGWAQVNGRNTISWEQKFSLDLEYIENVSFILDMKIFWLTFLKVMIRRGINPENFANIKEFQGSKKCTQNSHT